MEKQKQWLIELLVKVGVAQADTILLERQSGESSSDVTVDQLNKTYVELCKWVDVADNKVWL